MVCGETPSPGRVHLGLAESVSYRYEIVHIQSTKQNSKKNSEDIFKQIHTQNECSDI